MHITRYADSVICTLFLVVVAFLCNPIASTQHFEIIYLAKIVVQIMETLPHFNMFRLFRYFIVLNPAVVAWGQYYASLMR